MTFTLNHFRVDDKVAIVTGEEPGNSASKPIGISVNVIVAQPDWIIPL
jgi:hypothetical protein